MAIPYPQQHIPICWDFSLPHISTSPQNSLLTFSPVQHLVRTHPSPGGPLLYARSVPHASRLRAPPPPAQLRLCLFHTSSPPCEAYFGHGFTRRVDVLHWTSSWFWCFHSETLGNWIYEGAVVLLGLHAISMATHTLDLHNYLLRSDALHDVVDIPTSLKTEAHALHVVIPLVELGNAAAIHLSIDGTNEVDRFCMSTWDLDAAL